MSKYRSHAEKMLSGLIRREGIFLSYTGKGQFWIRLSNGKSANPDFINQSRRKIVEVFGGMGGDNPIHTKEEADERIKLYQEKGWECLILTDQDIYADRSAKLQKLPREFTLTERLKTFTGQLSAPEG